MDQKSGYALLTHGFVWHKDAFAIASKVVNYLGLFTYTALHARYNDFQFHDDQQSPEALFKTWEGVLSPGSLLWLATDEPEKFRSTLRSYHGRTKVEGNHNLLQLENG